MEIEKILHPTDFSDCAERALSQAVELARIFEAKLHLFHKVIYPFPEVPAEMLRHLEEEEGFERLLAKSLEEPRKEAERRLAERVQELARAGLGVSFSIASSGDAYDALMDVVEEIEPDLIVMGTHGREGWRKIMLGSMTERVLRQAPADVLTLRADARLVRAGDGFGTILVPVDFSDDSQRAVAAARRLVSRGGGSLCLLHVVEPVHSPFHPGKLVSRLDADRGLAGRYETALESMLGDSPGEALVAEGHVAGKILSTRERVGASMVVMGTRGLSGLKRFFVGSVTEKIVRYCEVPVMVVQ